jgi:hypothetical protein
MKEGSAIFNTASINADIPNPTLLAYATTEGAIQDFIAGLAQLLAEKGIRVNAVATGPIYTPLIPSTMPEDAVAEFAKNVPMKRPGQPAELATAYVMFPNPLSSYVSGETIAVTGGSSFFRNDLVRYCGGFAQAPPPSHRLVRRARRCANQRSSDPIKPMPLAQSAAV